MDEATKALVEQVAEEAAKKAVRETLTMLGIDPDDPIEFQKDTAYLRVWRTRVEKVQQKALLTVVALTATALAGALWSGLLSNLGL